MSKHALASPSISCDASLGLQHVTCPCNDHVLSQSFECAFREARTPQLDATHGGRGAALLEALPTGCVSGCRLTPRTLFQRSGASAKSAVEGHLRAGFLLGLGAQVERFATSGLSDPSRGLRRIPGVRTRPAHLHSQVNRWCLLVRCNALYPRVTSVPHQHHQTVCM